MDDADDDDSPVGLRNHWLEHPYTTKTRKAIVDQVGNLTQELHSACSRSTDPQVALAYGRLENAVTHLTLYTRQKP